MKAEHVQRVWEGKTATPSDGEEPERVIVGAHGEERPTRSVEQDYSASQKEQISSAAEERGDEELSRLVAGGLKLRVHREEPPPPKSEEEKQRDLALEVAEDRKQRLERSEGELDDHRISRASLQALGTVAEMVEGGYMSEEEALSEQQDFLERIEAGVQDDSLRHDTYRTAIDNGLVDEDLYDRHALTLQQRWVESQEADYQERERQAAAESEQDATTMEAVVSLEEQRLNALPPLAQIIARSLVEEQQEALAEMGTREMFTGLAYIRNVAKLVAESIESDNLQADIVRSWAGPLRAGVWDGTSRRDRREMSVHELGLAENPWTDEMQELARKRAEAEVARDIKLAQRQREGQLSGREKADLERAKLSAQVLR